MRCLKNDDPSGWYFLPNAGGVQFVADQAVGSQLADLLTEIGCIGELNHLRMELDAAPQQCVFEPGDPETHGIVQVLITEQRAAASCTDQLFGEFPGGGITFTGHDAGIQIFKIQQEHSPQAVMALPQEPKSRSAAAYTLG